jgi:predicted YcjX-like family ATPase
MWRRWPPIPRTGRRVDLRQVRLVLRFYPGGLLGRRSPIGSFARGAAELRIEIVDYPGEWLLDLPLLGQSYAEWSRVMLDLARHGVRALSPAIGSIFSLGTRQTVPAIRKRPARRMTSTVIFSRPAGNASN